MVLIPAMGHFPEQHAMCTVCNHQEANTPMANAERVLLAFQPISRDRTKSDTVLEFHSTPAKLIKIKQGITHFQEDGVLKYIFFIFQSDYHQK